MMPVQSSPDSNWPYHDGLCLAHESIDAIVDGINPEDQEELWIAPNPASDFLNIYAKQRPSGKVTVTLYTLMGERVKTLPIQEDPSLLVKEDVSALQSGTYLVRIEDNGTVLKTMRFVKR
jgi:hypothetical protein